MLVTDYTSDEEAPKRRKTVLQITVDLPTGEQAKKALMAEEALKKQRESQNKTARPVSSWLPAPTDEIAPTHKPPVPVHQHQLTKHPLEKKKIKPTQFVFNTAKQVAKGSAATDPRTDNSVRNIPELTQVDVSGPDYCPQLPPEPEVPQLDDSNIPVELPVGRSGAPSNFIEISADDVLQTTDTNRAGLAYSAIHLQKVKQLVDNPCPGPYAKHNINYLAWKANVTEAEMNFQKTYSNAARANTRKRYG
eukprot:TRINITY_DN34732_c0_g1_i1.p1 TRINITY_DN34732_c0_g1~~TRINITY_DN34732_c0_g1_i1.p1  ORF type:complete len:263 (+),score=35.75 TRINITY_DN34732_c0_g1_i1:45-791(+)